MDGLLVPRPPLAPGEHGEIWVKVAGPGKYVARTRVRDRDGQVRDVTASAATRGAARRELERRLTRRTTPNVNGMTGTMTVGDAGTFWLEHRQRSGLANGRGTVKPQTVAAYADAHHRIVTRALGNLRLEELSVGLLDGALQELEATGVSTAQARSVLNQTLALAVRHGALHTNPMALVASPVREDREVEALDVDQVRALRHAVSPLTLTKPGKRGPNGDLAALVDILLGTGARIGEMLALQWRHLDLAGNLPIARICGTLVEPRAGYVDRLHRQENTKSKTVRTLILPDHVADLLEQRYGQTVHCDDLDPVFASRNGTWLWPNNIRTRLRTATAHVDTLAGTTPHTLRRTVGTLIAHERGLDAAREQLGHSDPSVTSQAYVAARPLAPDLRSILDGFFEVPNRQPVEGDLTRLRLA